MANKIELTDTELKLLDKIGAVSHQFPVPARNWKSVPLDLLREVIKSYIRRECSYNRVKTNQYLKIINKLEILKAENKIKEDRMSFKDIFKKVVEDTMAATTDAPLPAIGVSFTNQKDIPNGNEKEEEITVQDLLELISDLKDVFGEVEEDDDEDTFALMFLDVLERVVKFKEFNVAIVNQLYFDLATMLDIADDEDGEGEEDEDGIKEIDLEEAVPVPRKINPAIHNARKIAYKKNKARIKIKARRFRKTASFKKYLRRKNQMKKVGKTANGRRFSRFF